jgi:hypothetical protein
MKNLNQTIQQVENGHAVYSKEEVLLLLNNIQEEEPTNLEQLKSQIQKAIEKTFNTTEFDYDFEIGRSNEITAEINNSDDFIYEMNSVLESIFVQL